VGGLEANHSQQVVGIKAHPHLGGLENFFFCVYLHYAASLAVYRAEHISLKEVQGILVLTE
jgi:hypothetical protein